MRLNPFRHPAAGKTKIAVPVVPDDQSSQAYHTPSGSPHLPKLMTVKSTGQSSSLDQVVKTDSQPIARMDPSPHTMPQALKHSSQSLAKRARSVSEDHSAVEQLLRRGLRERFLTADESNASHIQAESAKTQPHVKVDISPMPFVGHQGVGKLFAASQPRSGTQYRSAFFNQLISNNITHLVDLRTESRGNNADSDYRPRPGETRMNESLRISLSEGIQHNTDLKSYRLGIQPETKGAVQSDHDVNVSHFTAWPDFEVVSSQSLRDLETLVTEPLRKGENVLVHCKGGIGRTGTLITYCQAKSQLEQQVKEGKKITPNSIEDLVSKQREENIKCRRGGCIETPAQYDLVCKTLMEDFKIQA